MAKGKLLAEGTNRYTTDGADRGRETWQISQLGHGGILITSRAEFTGAPGATWNLTYEVDRSWSPVSLTVRLEQDGRVLNSTQRAEGDRWMARVDEDGQVNNYELPFSNKHEVDFASPLFKTVTLLRARLPVGASREFDVIFLRPHSLVPTADKQLYECLVEEKAQVPAGNYAAVKYRNTHPGKENMRVNDIWADHAGIVLLYQAQGQAQEQPQKDEIQLERYRRNERR